MQRVGGHNPVVVAGDDRWTDVASLFAQRRADRVQSPRRCAHRRRHRRIPSAPNELAPSHLVARMAKRIAFGSEEMAHQRQRSGTLWTVDLSGASRSAWTAPSTMGCINRRGRRPAGGSRSGRPRTAIATSGDRCEQWAAGEGHRRRGGGLRPGLSPDGAFIYFASDRGEHDRAVARRRRRGHQGDHRHPTRRLRRGCRWTSRTCRDGTSLIFRSKIESVNRPPSRSIRSRGRISAVTLLQHRTGILICQPTCRPMASGWCWPGNITTASRTSSSCAPTARA